MPRIKRGRPKKPTASNDDNKLSLKDLEEEIDDHTIFEGILARAELHCTIMKMPLKN